MQTEIRSLQLLERDLMAAAEFAASPARRVAADRRTRRWKGFVGAAAAVLVVAFLLGSMVRGGLSDSASEAPAAGVAVQGASATPANDRGDALEEQPGSLPAGPTEAPTSGPSEDLSKIIRDGKIGVVVEDGGFRRARNSVTDIADEAGGMVLSSSIDSRTGTFVLRIPAARFDDVMVAVGGLGHVDYEEENGQDVTADYIDQRAHLSILKQRKQLLQSLLVQAGTVSGILSLSGKIEDVQFSIEKIQGQLRYLDNQVAESTVRVELREKSAPDETSAVTEGVDKPSLAHAWQVSLQGFLNVIAAVIVGLGYLVPLGLIVLVAWLALSLTRRRGRGSI